jgi:hypothetical protein
MTFSSARSSACESLHAELREIERRLEPECEVREVLAHDRAHLVEARDRVAHLELGERRHAPRPVRCEVVERLLAPSEEDRLAFAMEVERGAEVDRDRQPLRTLLARAWHHRLNRAGSTARS